MIDFEELTMGAQTDGIGRLVVGVIVPRDDGILILQRKPDDFMPNIYELPSGAVEPGETLASAVAPNSGFVCQPAMFCGEINVAPAITLLSGVKDTPLTTRTGSSGLKLMA
jgi:hypothetical protein